MCRGNKVIDGRASNACFPDMMSIAMQQLQLVNNVVLAGGGSCIEGTLDRLKVEFETAIYGQGQVGSMGRQV